LVLEAQYGVKVLVRQGDSRGWLNEKRLGMFFRVLMARIFYGETGANALAIV